MDFFQQQENARKHTKLLVFFYVLALLCLCGVMYALVIWGVSMANNNDPFSPEKPNFYFDPTIFPIVVGSVSLLVLGGSFFKMSQLSAGGGKAVAEMLGGRQILPDTRDPAERRLYNVVEEMAIASGVPIPPVYVMDNERSINAFAAGVAPNQAVVAVNRGTIELLTRDELQGVIAHEFSHILNGDMRISMRLIGVLFGLQLLALVGYYAMRLGMAASHGSSMTNALTRDRNGKNGNGGTLVLILGGLAVMIIGYVGVFFSAMIKAAISRQREFLADASAVQFTRLTDGIAGALKKIGCKTVGSNVQNEHAAETNHMFFGEVCSAFSLGGLFATHPNLTTRIRRLDPSFDGRFPVRVEPVIARAETQNLSQKREATKKSDPLRRIDPTSGMRGLGQLNLAQIAIAETLLQTIPAAVENAARSPLTAKATFYALLLDADNTIRDKQLASVAKEETDYVFQAMQAIYRTTQTLPQETKIPVVLQITAALRQLTVTQYQQFSSMIDVLIAADQKMDLLEYTLKAILLRDLDVHFGLAKPLTVRYFALGGVSAEIVSVLSYFAFASHENAAAAQAAFKAALGELGFAGTMQGQADCTVKNFDVALRKLAETNLPLKKRFFGALMTCAKHDGEITVREGEILRAVAAMLAIPMPNFAAN